MPQSSYRSMTGLRRMLTISLAAVLALSSFLLAACSNGEPDQPQRIADYGRYGAAFAEKFAENYPYRSPGSAMEKAASQLIIKELTSLGYDPQLDPFTYSDQDGNVRYSRNIWIRIPGTGWTDEQGMLEHRQVIIGAHYDTAIDQMFAESQVVPETEEETTASETETATDPDASEEPVVRNDEILPDWQSYNGIHDNAAAIGALLTIARELRDKTLKHDVILVAFGAGEAKQAGSSHFAASMSADEIAATDAMYAMDRLYAGDKIYAHSGWNSLRGSEEKDYQLRRKLYELTDVFFEYELYTNNGYMLYTNQNIFSVALPAAEPEPVETEEQAEAPAGETEGESTELTDEAPELPPEPVYIYREWTVHESDYRPFDQLGIPIVFFDSGDYKIEAPEEFQESHHPVFSTTNGRVSHTGFDSVTLLDQIFSLVARDDQASEDAEEDVIALLDDQLKRRINNTAFLIMEAIDRDVSQTDTTP
ncbi:MAG: M28 family peptidase [Eubacteriales bacterium]|nr:M28 family peptidase [Eubacteriales bacterium]MDD3866398.1 M28 family peptidase [Eubacteriales bacterium]MDD4461279.1 M28 family peptidase [Eubacteriales bacterium]